MVVTLTLISVLTFGQQPVPIGLVFSPRINKFAISGVGGLNAYLQEGQKLSGSAQIALDWNIAINDKNSKKKNKPQRTTFTTLVKYNPKLQTSYNAGDSIEISKIGFVDNEYNGMLGFRLTNIRQLGIDDNARILRAFFVDAAFTRYLLRNSLCSLNTGFWNFNINTGFQFGFLNNTDFGLLGVIFSPQLNFIYVFENNMGGKSFEELTKSPNKLSRHLLGAGFKISVPVNDFYLYFETRKYYPVDNNTIIPGLTNRAIFSFGGVATGNIFKTKTKETKI